MARLTDTQLIRTYLENHMGGILDISYDSLHVFSEIPSSNLRKYIARFVDDGTLRKISKGIYAIGGTKEDDKLRMIKHYLGDGYGVPSVVKVYGDNAYIFTDFYIDVVIPFNRQGFNKTTRRSDRKQPEKIRESIMDLLSSNGKISRKDLALLLNVTEGSIRHHLNKLQEEGLIKHIGPDKGGYWEVLK